VAVALPEMVDPEFCAAAETVELPVASAVAIPLLMLTTLALEELQLAEAVRSFVEPSE
jgi:hypothetical protein